MARVDRAQNVIGDHDQYLALLG
ncbi:uncharacterized protein METZ01_LOCUS390875, partial [marine metagenome]